MNSKFKKRISPVQGVVADPLAAELHELGIQIRRGQIEEALVRLDELAVINAGDPIATSKIAALAADSQMELGRYSEALTYYRNIKASLSEDGGFRAWLRPSIGEVRALLKSIQINEAVTQANELWQTAQNKVDEFKALFEDAGQAPIIISQQPLPLVEVAIKLGNIFIHEGQTAEAKQWFLKAVELSPDGAIKAKAALARLALAANDPATAKEHAQQALLDSNFSAASVSVWKLLIGARSRLGEVEHPSTLFEQMLQTAQTGVRERMIFAVVTSLRAFGSIEWRVIAENWLSAEPESDEIIAIELSKIILADDKLQSSNPELIALASHRILQSDLVSPSESISMVKNIVLYELSSDVIEPNTAALADQVERLFGKEKKTEALHGMALSAAEIGSHDLARTLFNEILEDPAVSVDSRTKAQWAYATMESEAGNYAESANIFLDLSGKDNLSPAHKVQTIRYWLEALMQADAAPSGEEAREKVDEVLSGLSNPRDLLDIGRQISLIRNPGFDDLKESLYQLAGDSAWSAISADENPHTALSLLIHLTRRQYYDFSHTTKIVDQWHSLTPEKRAWFRSEANIWWEYISLVFDSLTKEGFTEEAIDIAESRLNSDEMTPEGYVWIGVSYSNWLIREDRQLSKALSIIDIIVTEQPTHRQASWAYYWKALLARKEGLSVDAADYGKLIRICYAGKPSFTWQYYLDAMACLLISDMDVNEAVEFSVSSYQREFLEQSLNQVQRDLQLL